MKFELHCHSHYSRGRNIPIECTSSPRDIAEAIKRKGFGGFAITDHDTVRGWKEGRKEAKKRGLVFIPGLEVSTKSGHLIGLGLNEGVKSRMGLEESIEAVREQGGIAVAPHPFDLRSEGVGDGFRICDAVETFNSMNVTRFENMLAVKEAAKAGIPSVGGSDAHTPEMIGMTENLIKADDMDSALKMLKKGKVQIRGNYTPMPMVVRWARERMKRSEKDIHKYIEKNYSAPRAAIARFMLKRFIGSESSFWDGLAYFSLAVSSVYSYARFVSR